MAAPLTARNYAVWVAVCAAAELMGIALGGAWWAAMDRLDPDPETAPARWASLGLKAASGAVEGIVLGGLQALVLRRLYPALPVLRWIGLTALLAVGGWAAGSAIPIFGRFEDAAGAPFDPPLGWTVLASALFGAGLGAAFGAVQALALRRAASGSGWWILANAAGWALALPLIYTAASTGPPDQGLALVVAKGLAAGLAAGIVLGAVTGLAFARMHPRFARI